MTVYGFLETLKVPPGEYLLQGTTGFALARQLIAMAKERGKTISVLLIGCVCILNGILLYTQ